MFGTQPAEHQYNLHYVGGQLRWEGESPESNGDLGKQNGTEHLILADRYSGWPMVKPLRKQNTKLLLNT